MSEQELQPRPDGPQPTGGSRISLLKMRLDAAVLSRVGLDRLAQRGNIRWAQIAAFFAIFSPTIVAAIYFGLLAAPRYVSEASFVVRTAAKSSSGTGLSAILQMTGVSQSQDDVFAVQEFMSSRASLDQLEAKLPLRDMFGRPEGDWVATYPSIFFGSSREDFYDYYRGMVDVTFSSQTGISKLSVQAFRPEDAQLVAANLLDFSEKLINDLNQKIQADAVSYAQQDVAQAQDRVMHTQALLTAYRNKEMTIDPQGNAVTLGELSGGLQAELAALEARIAELESSAPDSPTLPGLRSRVVALKAQVDKENQNVATSEGGDAGLAQKISEYERLMLVHQFSVEDLGKSMASLELSKREARRQQLFLERIVEPDKPDVSRAPKGLQTVLAVFATNLVLLLAGWFIWVGVKEHAATM